MKNKRYSIKDIASALKVSVTTVSFVLNGKAEEKRISKMVAKKVLDYAKSVNYKPNQLAQSLRTGRSKIIVVMVEDISNYFFSKLGRIIEDIAYKKGYKVLFCSNENSDERSKDLLNLFRERQVDAYIIVPSPGIQEEINSLISDGIPVVLFDRYFPEIDSNYVIINNSEAVYNASQHLVDNRFKKIGFITIVSSQTQMNDRKSGYLAAMQGNELEDLVLEVSFEEKEILEIKKDVYRFIKDKGLDAIFFATNYLTQIGLEVIREHFPEKIKDLGIITFDDNDFFKIYSPPITAVSQPLEEIGKELMDTVLKMLNSTADKSYKSQDILPAILIERMSSAPREFR